MIYARFYLGDYLRDTARLTLLEHGAYSQLLFYYYADEKPLPLDRAEIYLMLRAMTPADRKAVDKIVTLYFTEHADGFRNARADREIAVSAAARANGMGGGRKAKDATPAEDDPAPPTEGRTKKQTKKAPKPVTEDRGKPGHPPTTILHPSAASPQPVPAPGGAGPGAPGETSGSKVWHAYSSAYEDRYRVCPTRNAHVNSQLAQFVKRVPADEAPDIAAFYVRSNQQFYVRMKHSVKSLLADAEKLRTEWATRRHGTEAEARQVDRTQARGNVFGDLLQEARDAA